MANNYAEQWAALLQNVPVKEEEEPTAEIELCGFRFLAKRPPLSVWIRSGRLPQSLLVQLLNLEKDPDAEISSSTIPVEDLPQTVDFQREAVLHAIVSPRIVTGRPGDGEFSYMALCEQRPDLINAIVGWVLLGSPGVPVKTTEGELSVDALSRFRQDQPGGGVPATDRADGADVRHTAESVAPTA